MQSFNRLYDQMRVIAQRPSQDAVITERVADWSAHQNRRVLKFLGTTPEDVKMRFVINRILRSGSKGGDPFVATVVKGSTAQVVYQSETALPFSDGGLDYPTVPSHYWHEIENPKLPNALEAALRGDGNLSGMAVVTDQGEFLSEDPKPTSPWDLRSPSEPELPLGGHIHRGLEVDPQTGGIAEPQCSFWIDTQKGRWRCNERSRHYHDPRPHFGSEGPALVNVAVYFHIDTIETSGLTFPEGTKWIRQERAEVYATTAKAAQLSRALPGVGYAEFVGLLNTMAMTMDVRLPKLRSELEEVRVRIMADKGVALHQQEVKTAQSYNVMEARRAQLATIIEIVDRMEGAWIRQWVASGHAPSSAECLSIADLRTPGAPVLRLPVTVSGTVCQKIRILTSHGERFTGEVYDYLRSKLKAYNLDYMTELAPAVAIDPSTGYPCPLPPSTELALLKDARRKRDEETGKPASDPASVAWKWLINSFNDYQLTLPKAERAKPIPIEKNLVIRWAANKKPAQKAAEKEDLSSVRQLVEDLKKDLSGAPKEPTSTSIDAINAYIASREATDAAMASTMKMMAEEIVKLRDGPKKSEQESPFTHEGDATGSFSTASESYDFDDLDSEGAPEYPISDLGEYLRDGVYWTPLLDVSQLPLDGASVVAIHPVTGVPFVAPFRVDLSQKYNIENGFIQAQAVPEKSAMKGGSKPAGTNRVPPPLPPNKPEVKKADEEEAEEEILSPETQSSRKGKARATGNTILDSIPPLVMYLCPACGRTRVQEHLEDCELKGCSWGKLSKEGKAERDQYLADPKMAKPKNNSTASKPGSEKKQAPETPKGESGGKKKDDLERSDPLGTKSDFKLSEQQEKGLRKFFGLKELPPKDIFDSLSKEDQRDLRQQSAMPKWAIAAVRHHQNNFNAILAGKLTKELFQAGKFQKADVPRTISGQEVTKRWLQIKDRFKDTLLLEVPQNQKQKAFRKAFDELKSEVGDRPELPTPKKGRGQSNQPSGSGGRNRPQNTDSGMTGGNLRETLLLFAEIAKAMKG
jgi:hypothetical protein